MLDFNNTFNKYETLVQGVEKSVKKIQESSSEWFRCAEKCSDCCQAVFDLSLIESVYINYRFYEFLNRNLQDPILDRADRADRQSYRIRRRIHKMITRGEKSEEEIFSLLAEERIRCPFLNESDLCALYGFRPITCRIYGLPTIIRGAGHTCGKSGFKEGVAYTSINLDRINQHLHVLSRELLEEIGTQDNRLEERLVPLSTALLTDYNEEYFGLTPVCST